jgi:uncharacterized protein YdbL (DUF1318 family)
MKTYAPHEPRRPRHIRVPAFIPVPQRARRDGWTAERQGGFLVALAASGSVSAAVRAVGMSRETAYRLRRQPGAESFAATWDLVLGCELAQVRKITHEERLARALGGLVKPVVWRGRCVGIEQKADNAALLGLLGQLGTGQRLDE